MEFQSAVFGGVGVLEDAGLLLRYIPFTRLTLPTAAEREGARRTVKQCISQAHQYMPSYCWLALTIVSM